MTGIRSGNIAEQYPERRSQWDPNANGGVQFDDAVGTHSEHRWTCERGHVTSRDAWNNQPNHLPHIRIRLRVPVQEVHGREHQAFIVPDQSRKSFCTTAGIGEIEGFPCDRSAEKMQGNQAFQRLSPPGIQ